MKRLTDAEKCCKVVEALVSEDICQDIEFRIAVHKDYKITGHEVKLLNNKITKIYEFTHATNKHSCQAYHTDWLNDMKKTYADMKKHREF